MLCRLPAPLSLPLLTQFSLPSGGGSEEKREIESEKEREKSGGREREREREIVACQIVLPTGADRVWCLECGETGSPADL